MFKCKFIVQQTYLYLVYLYTSWACNIPLLCEPINVLLLCFHIFISYNLSKIFYDNGALNLFSLLFKKKNALKECVILYSPLHKFLSNIFCNRTSETIFFLFLFSFSLSFLIFMLWIVWKKNYSATEGADSRPASGPGTPTDEKAGQVGIGKSFNFLQFSLPFLYKKYLMSTNEKFIANDREKIQISNVDLFNKTFCH